MPRDLEPHDGEPKDNADPDWIDELYAEGANEQPPASLDASIRGAARQAPEPWYSSQRRLTALATAASLVLAASVAYFAVDVEQLIDEPPQGEPAALQQPSAVPAIGLPGERLPGKAEADTAMPAAPTKAARPPAAAAPESPVKTSEFPTEPRRARDAGRAPDARAPADVVLEEAIPTAGTTSLAAGATDLDALLPGECGEPPGEESERRVHEDATGWYLQVGTGAGAIYWRCIDNRWTEIEPPGTTTGSQEQQPDPDNDQ